MKLDWESTPEFAPEIPEVQRNDWAVEAIEQAKKEPEGFFYSLSGRSLVIAVQYRDGDRQVFDCVVKRRAVVARDE